MKFKTHNDKDIDLNGTHLQGQIDTTYSKLKKIFGKPNNGDGYKTDAEWEIEFEDGTVATIYNYKDGFNYNGREYGMSKTKITDWHIGGYDKKAYEMVCAMIKEGK